jgi:hypothetical protein
MILTSPTASATNLAVLVGPPSVLPELATRCTTVSFSEYAGSIPDCAGAVRSTSMTVPGLTAIWRALSIAPTTTSGGEPLAEIGGRVTGGAVEAGGGEVEAGGGEVAITEAGSVALDGLHPPSDTRAAATPTQKRSLTTL